MGKNRVRTYFGRGVSAVEDVEVVRRRQQGASRVRVDPEDVEVVSATVRREQQEAAGVEGHGHQRLRVRHEVRNHVVGQEAVLLPAGPPTGTLHHSQLVTSHSWDRRVYFGLRNMRLRWVE